MCYNEKQVREKKIGSAVRRTGGRGVKVSINKKYTFVVSVALFATVLAFMGLVHYAVVGYYEQKVRLGDTQLTHILAMHITRNIRAEDEIIGMLADYPDLLDRPIEEQRFVLLKTARNHPHYELISTVDMNGDQIARSWGDPGPRGDRAWFQNFVRTRRGAISDVYVSRSTGNDIVTITKGLYGANGNPEGLIMADIRTSDLKNLISSANSDPDCDVYLLDNSRHVIAAPLGKEVDDGDDLIAHAQSGKLFTTPDGRRAIGAYIGIDIPESNVHWSLVLVRDYDAALAPITGILQRTLTLGIIIALLAVFVLYYMNRRVTQGFLRAGQVIRLVGQGDYSQRFEYQGSDELGDIAKNLNHMTDLLARAKEKQQADAQKIQNMAYHDGLTGLPNRRHFMNTARRVLVEAYGKDRLAALFFIDLDKFKEVNDTYGHAAGDELLIEVGRRLTEVAGRIEIVCRLGGDEFLMFLPGANELEIEKKAQAVIDGLEQPFHLSGGDIVAFVSASIGIARYPEDARTVDDLVQLADAAMYEAKQNGRGRYVVSHAGNDSK